MASLTRLRSFITQFWPHGPTFTEADVPMGSQAGRVFIVTGGNAGIGYELCQILFGTGATVYMATRSKVSSFNYVLGKCIKPYPHLFMID